MNFFVLFTVALVIFLAWAVIGAETPGGLPWFVLGLAEIIALVFAVYMLWGRRRTRRPVRR
jgi:hypothetical protein